MSVLLCCYSTSCSHTCGIVLLNSLTNVNNLFVADKDNILKYDRLVLTRKCSVHFAGVHAIAVMSLLIVKCAIRVACSFILCHHASSSMSAGISY